VTGTRESRPDTAGAAPSDTPGAEFVAIATDSRTVAVWTLVSRVTGFGRLAAIAAVLGPTYFGNLFQTANHLPNIIHELLAGALMSALLVPPLVRHVASGDRVAVQRLANGFLGVVVALFLLVVVLGVLAAPLLVGLLTIGVSDAAARAEQYRLGWPLLAMLLPQILLYGIAATGVAVQHAHRRFALAAAAPALENVGVAAVLLMFAVLFGVGMPIDRITTAQIMLLGLGSTAAVMLHAGAQWWGAYRLGIVLWPQAGWRDPEVRGIIRLAVPSSGYAVLESLSFLGLMVVAGSVPGGAVAFHIGFNFFNLPVALCGRPLSAAQLPRLARSFQRGNLEAFHVTYRSSLALGLFVALPAAFLFLGMPEALARAMSFGEMATGPGVALVAAAISSLGPGIVGESAFIVAMSACYARRDALSPLRAMVLREAIVLTGMAIALATMEGTAVLVTLGLAVSIGALIAARYLHRCQLRVLPALPARRGWPIADLAVAAVATVPGAMLAGWLDQVVVDSYQSLGAGLVGVAVSGLLYLAAQWLRGSPEFRTLFAALVGPRSSAGAWGTVTPRPTSLGTEQPR
jgi:putative peptidoglycan lipid II flippase